MKRPPGASSQAHGAYVVRMCPFEAAVVWVLSMPIQGPLDSPSAKIIPPKQEIGPPSSEQQQSTPDDLRREYYEERSTRPRDPDADVDFPNRWEPSIIDTVPR